jgi:hypothetical protein
MKILKACGNSIQTLIKKCPGSIISPGSEFRHPDLLESLFLHHHNWPVVKQILEVGSMWPLDPITEVERQAKNIEFIHRGNHKSAIKYDAEYKKILTTEINQGWMFPVPLQYINKILHGELAPIGIDDKVWSEQPDGSRKIKFRLTHDQSFEASVGRSVNGRVQKEKLNSLFYGGCISRLLHYIVDIRLRHPVVPILGGKSDFKAAYRRVSLHGDIAAKCSIMYKELAIPSMRLTFGGSPCPTEFCTISELCADLANDLLHCKEWNPALLMSPNASRIKSPILLDETKEFAQAKDLDVTLAPDDSGKIDIFIDDGLVITPDLGDNRCRALQALLLSIHTICRPLDIAEPILREDCLSLGKLDEEGQLSEKFTLLGWIIDTRALTISLPTKKSVSWNKDLQSIITKKKVSFGLLESVIGRLNHAATACPFMRYFLNRIRLVLTNWDISKKSKKVERYLPSQVLEDLRLWRDDFLPNITKGMSINLITYRRPTFICWSDACPTGMGGFDHMGFAWRWAIPNEFQEGVTNRNNCLEFLASIVTVWQSILHHRAKKEECFLSLGDNTSAIGWLHKANVDQDKNLPLFLAARKFAKIMLASNSCLYSQHITGVSNGVADALSRKFELSDDDLTFSIFSSHASQVHPFFKIYPVHPEIVSWMTYWLRKCNETKGLLKTQKTKSHECGDDGQNMLPQWVSVKTSGLPPCSQSNGPILLPPLPLPCVEENFLDQTKRTWLRQQSKRPWQNWVRSLGQTWGTTPHMEAEQTHFTHYLPGNLEE